jgi:hypothetical protein
MAARRPKALLESQIEDIDSIIKDYEKKYYILNIERDALLRLSAESLSDSLISEYIIYLTFYQDESLKSKLFDLDEIANFDDNEISQCVVPYKEYANLFNFKNIKKISINSRILDTIKNSSNAESFFSRSGYLLTQNQITLFETCKYFISILDNIKDITNEERQDPDLIEKIFITQMNEKNKNKNQPASNLRSVAEKFKNS